MSLFTYVNESEYETIEPVFATKTPKSDDGIARLAEKCRRQFKGVKQTAEHRAKNSAAQKANHLKNPRRNFIWITPVGEFVCSALAAEANGVTRDTLVHRCRFENIAGFSRKKLDKSTNRDNVVK